MAAIDPNADAPEGTAPFFATLKLVRRPLGQDDFQYSDEEDESESEDEVEMKKIQQKAKKVKKQAATAAAAKGNKMDVEGESDEEDDSDDDEPFETEEFVICTLNPDGVCRNSKQPPLVTVRAKPYSPFYIGLPAAPGHCHRRVRGGFLQGHRWLRHLPYRQLHCPC